MDRSQALADLSPLYCEALRLDDSGHDHEGIATHLDVAAEAVPALLEIARAKLTRLLQEP